MNGTKPTPAYHAAHEAAVFFPRGNAGYLEIHGEDRVDFLQRQTTNDLSRLDPGHSLNNVLTSSTARVLETFRMFEAGEHIAMLIPPGRTDSTESFLKSHIFFMDKVEVQNHSADWAQIEIHGPQVKQTLEKIGIGQLPLLDEILNTEFAEKTIRIIGINGLTTDLGFLFLVKKEDEDVLLNSLQEAGFLELGQEDYQILRVEAGQPAMGHELTQDFTPLESGLVDWVSDTKGCYTGQEVIARQITYDKVTKGLVQLQLEKMTALGAKVLADGKTAGTITSTANSPKLGPIALAVLKRPHNAPGTAVQVESPDRPISGLVADLDGIRQKT